MGKLIPSIFMMLCLCTSIPAAKAAMRINHAAIAKAEAVINTYVREKYAWDENMYEVCIDLKESMKDIIEFLVYYKDDKNLTSFGGGKSFIVIFDMQKMEVIDQLWFQ